jgi:hypothetical protein
MHHRKSQHRVAQRSAVNCCLFPGEQRAVPSICHGAFVGSKDASDNQRTWFNARRPVMELARKSNELFPSNDIRPLNDTELDAVNGGIIHLLIGGAILATALLAGDRYGDAPWHHWGE